MKILMTLAGLEIGGAETHVTELAKALKRKGHDLAIISGGGVYVDEIEAHGIRHYKVTVNSKNPIYMRRAVCEMKRIILSEKPDIVHAHARIPAFLMGIVHRLLKRKFPFVFVTSCHGAFSTAFPLKLLTDWGQMSLAVSDDLKKYLIDNYGVPSDNISVSINGIDMAKFNSCVDGSRIRAEFGISPESKCVVCVTRLDPRVCSHAYRMIEIMPALDKAFPGVTFMLVGGGDAFDDLSEKAKAMNEKLGRRAVILTGGRTDVNEIHACADVCVGVSRAILEPMAMAKKCVIVGEWGYIGILNENNLEQARGCNFTCRDCDEVKSERLASDIIKLLSMSEAEGKSVGEYAKSVIASYYSAAKMAEDNEAMYIRALRKCRNQIAILGYYGFKNAGDDALLGVIVDDLRKVDNTCAINVLAHNPDEITALYDVKAEQRFGIRTIYRALKGAKLFILGGGSLIQDVTSSKSLYYYLFCARLAKLLGLKVMLYANGIGPVNKKRNRILAKKILADADCITLRDNDSLEFLEQIGVSGQNISVTADPAFGLSAKPESISEARAILSESGIRDNDEFVCLSVRNLVGMAQSDSEKFVSELSAFADMIAEKYNVIPVFIAMQYSKDSLISKRVIDGMKHRGIFIDKELCTHEILGVISHSRAVFALRLHMLIFGAVCKKAVFGIEYDPKVGSFSDMVGNRFSISPDELTDKKCEELLCEFMTDTDRIAAGISEKLPSLCKKAFDNALTATKLIG